jgi:hypothetical protein
VPPPFTDVQTHEQLSCFLTIAVSFLSNLPAARHAAFAVSAKYTNQTDPDQRYASLFNLPIEGILVDGLLKLSQQHDGRLSTAAAEQTTLAGLKLCLEILRQSLTQSPSIATLPQRNAFKETVCHLSALLLPLIPQVHLKHEPLDDLFINSIAQHITLPLEDVDQVTRVLGESAVSAVIGILESVWLHQRPEAVAKSL